MDVIYEPKGKAREYAELAVNLYDGCIHGCKYCYAPKILRKSTEEFHHEPQARKNILERLKNDCKKIQFIEKRPILLCFSCDPYQPHKIIKNTTHEAIKIIKDHGLNLSILTKGGFRALDDLNLLDENDYFGVSLTFSDWQDSKKWEPMATIPQERIETLRIAKSKGLKTWVSLEPIVYPEQTKILIEKTESFVDKYMVGKLNYHSYAKEIDWKVAVTSIVETLENYYCDYYIKKDTKPFLEK